MKKRDVPGAVMVHLQHTPLIKQERIHLLSQHTHWPRKHCVQSFSTIMKAFSGEIKNLSRKKKGAVRGGLHLTSGAVMASVGFDDLAVVAVSDGLLREKEARCLIHPMD